MLSVPMPNWFSWVAPWCRLGVTTYLRPRHAVNPSSSDVTPTILQTRSPICGRDAIKSWARKPNSPPNGDARNLMRLIEALIAATSKAYAELPDRQAEYIARVRHAIDEQLALARTTRALAHRKSNGHANEPRSLKPPWIAVRQPGPRLLNVAASLSSLSVSAAAYGPSFQPAGRASHLASLIKVNQVVLQPKQNIAVQHNATPPSWNR